MQQGLGLGLGLSLVGHGYELQIFLDFLFCTINNYLHAIIVFGDVCSDQWCLFLFCRVVVE